MASTHPTVVTADTFLSEVVEKSNTTPVLVDFWAEWCAPCKQLMPVLERLVAEYEGRFVWAKVNTDEEQPLAAQIGVRGLPTVVLFKDGQAADHFVGVIPEGQIRQLLDRHVPPPPRTPLQVAHELKRAGDYAAARKLLDEALTKEPRSIELQCELGEIKALEGDLDGAKQQLTELQAREPTAPAVKRLAAFVAFSDTVRAHPDSAAIQARLLADPTDLSARHALAVHRLLGGDYDPALEDWLSIMRTNRKFNDDLARKSLVMAFEVIGNADPRVAQTRRAMARLLF